MKSLLKPSDYSRFHADMTVGQNDPFYAPIPYRRDTLDAASGASTLTINDMPFWAVAGALVVLESDTHLELATIQSVASPTITLTAPLTASFPSGSRIYLAQECIVEASIGAKSPVSNVTEIATELIFKPGLSPHPFLAVTPTQHNGVDVFLDKPNWARPLDHTFFTERGLFDSGRGLLKSFDLEDFSKYTRKAQFTKMTATKTEEIVSFFNLKKGQRGSFYAPTYMNEMQVFSEQASGTQVLTIEGTDFHAAYNGHPIWKTIFVRANGVSQINDIVSIATSGGNSVLTMADTWSMTIPAGNAVSWCPLSRFASDMLTVEWLTDQVAEMALSFTTIRNIS